jgi:ATP-dependent DNA helicase PIF1
MIDFYEGKQCRNDLIQQRNNEMIDMLPGDEFESVSIDFCMNDDDNRFYDSDTLNQQEVSGLPPHRLRLKKNACVILIRSLMPKKGFCNGKRCLVKGISNNLLILTPLDSNGPDILVPRLPMECTDSKLGIPFIRRQYPILLAYYLTINRSQGQTLDVVGVELPTSVFMHGQIYVSYGRTGDPVELHIFANQDEFHDIQDHLQAGKTYVKNVVWPELLIN